MDFIFMVLDFRFQILDFKFQILYFKLGTWKQLRDNLVGHVRYKIGITKGQVRDN